MTFWLWIQSLIDQRVALKLNLKFKSTSVDLLRLKPQKWRVFSTTCVSALLVEACSWQPTFSTWTSSSRTWICSKVTIRGLPLQQACSSSEIDGVLIELFDANCWMSSLGQHLSQDFLKLNPHHTVPTYQDDKITLSESRAIMAYLVNRFASPENASLYPADPVKRGNLRLLN